MIYQRVPARLEMFSRLQCQCRDVLQTATSSYTLRWPKSLSLNFLFLLFLLKTDIMMREEINIAVMYCKVRQLLCSHGHSFQILCYTQAVSATRSSWISIIVYWLAYWQEDEQEIKHFTVKPVKGTFGSKGYHNVYTAFSLI